MGCSKCRQCSIHTTSLGNPASRILSKTAQAFARSPVSPHLIPIMPWAATHEINIIAAPGHLTAAPFAYSKSHVSVACAKS
jgi:hypothetical protein